MPDIRPGQLWWLEAETGQFCASLSMVLEIHDTGWMECIDWWYQDGRMGFNWVAMADYMHWISQGAVLLSECPE